MWPGNAIQNNLSLAVGRLKHVVRHWAFASRRTATLGRATAEFLPMPPPTGCLATTRRSPRQPRATCAAPTVMTIDDDGSYGGGGGDGGADFGQWSRFHYPFSLALSLAGSHVSTSGS